MAAAARRFVSRCGYSSIVLQEISITLGSFWQTITGLLPTQISDMPRLGKKNAWEQRGRGSSGGSSKSRYPHQLGVWGAL